LLYNTLKIFLLVRTTDSLNTI